MQLFRLNPTPAVWLLPIPIWPLKVHVLVLIPYHHQHRQSVSLLWPVPSYSQRIRYLPHFAFARNYSRQKPTLKLPSNPHPVCYIQTNRTCKMSTYYRPNPSMDPTHIQVWIEARWFKFTVMGYTSSLRNLLRTLEVEQSGQCRKVSFLAFFG